MERLGSDDDTSDDTSVREILKSIIGIHSLKLTYLLRIGHSPKVSFIFQPSIFRCYRLYNYVFFFRIPPIFRGELAVSFREGIVIWLPCCFPGFDDNGLEMAAGIRMTFRKRLMFKPYLSTRTNTRWLGRKWRDSLNFYFKNVSPEFTLTKKLRTFSTPAKD